MIGNDIVALSDRKTDPRFLERVFTKEEQQMILDHSEPSMALWILWAIKEAAFKALYKVDPNIRFTYKAFVVKENPWRCCYKDRVVYASVSVTSNYVHAISYLSQEDLPVIFTEIGFSESEQTESQAVRLLAQKMLEKMGYPRAEILNRPPQVYQNGKRVEELDISLSHDQQYLAVTIGLLR